jgi:HNH endonuclease
MRRRFTEKSCSERLKTGRTTREEVFKRDQFRCVFCGRADNTLSIDHLIPLALGGVSEITNYVTACIDCNQCKADLPPEVYLGFIDVPLENLPVHGDQMLDNPSLPPGIRAIRRRIYDRLRQGQISAGGASTHKRIEMEYRRELWRSGEGAELMTEYPTLPGHVLVMVPEIRTIAKTEREFLLLLELAKSASTRNLLGTSIVRECDAEAKVRSISKVASHIPLRLRLEQALKRFEHEVRRRGGSP